MTRNTSSGPQTIGLDRGTATSDKQNGDSWATRLNPDHAPQNETSATPEGLLIVKAPMIVTTRTPALALALQLIQSQIDNLESSVPLPTKIAYVKLMLGFQQFRGIPSDVIASTISKLDSINSVEELLSLLNELKNKIEDFNNPITSGEQ